MNTIGAPIFLIAILLFCLLATIISLVVALATLKNKKISTWAFIITGVFAFLMILFIMLFIGYTIRKSIQRERGVLEDFRKSRKYEKEDNRDYLITDNDSNEQIKLLHSYVPDSLKNQVPASFYTHFGDYEYNRYPLVYPYSLNGHYDVDHCEIYDESEATNISESHWGAKQLPISFITEFTFNKDLFLAKKATDAQNEYGGVHDNEYLIFNFHTQQVQEFETEAQMLKRAKELGFTNPDKMLDIYDYDVLFY